MMISKPVGKKTKGRDLPIGQKLNGSIPTQRAIFMPRLGGAYCFRRVRSQRMSSCSQRTSVDWGTMGLALGKAYDCYAHISSFID